MRSYCFKLAFYVHTHVYMYVHMYVGRCFKFTSLKRRRFGYPFGFCRLPFAFTLPQTRIGHCFGDFVRLKVSSFILFIYNLLFSLLMLMLSTIVVNKPVSYYVPHAHSYTLRMIFFFFLINLFGFGLIHQQLI